MYPAIPYSRAPLAMVLFDFPGFCGWSFITYRIFIHTEYKAKHEAVEQLVECLLTVNVP